MAWKPGHFSEGSVARDSRGVLCPEQSTWLEEINNQSICPVTARLFPLCKPAPLVHAWTGGCPRIYSMAGLPEGPSWEQVRRLIASLNTGRPSHIRDRAIILLLGVYGLRIGEACALTLDDLDWTNEKIRVRRLKNKRIQEFPLTTEVGNAILKYLRTVRPRCSSRCVFLSLHKPHRPMMTHGTSSSIAFHIL